MPKKSLPFLWILIAVLTSAANADNTDSSAPEVHCKHFFYGCPEGTMATNDLIIRDAYALSSNDETKFADWVAYRLDAATVEGDAETKRKWMTDPWLAPEETLEAKPDDYGGANEALRIDRGHQAPLASFGGTADKEAIDC